MQYDVMYFVDWIQKLYLQSCYLYVTGPAVTGHFGTNYTTSHNSRVFVLCNLYNIAH